MCDFLSEKTCYFFCGFLHPPHTTLTRSLSLSLLPHTPPCPPQIRKLEVFVGLLILVIAACFFAEMAYAPIRTAEVLEGMLLPYLRSPGATALAVSLVGAVVMP